MSNNTATSAQPAAIVYVRDRESCLPDAAANHAIKQGISSKNFKNKMDNHQIFLPKFKLATKIMGHSLTFFM